MLPTPEATALEQGDVIVARIPTKIGIIGCGVISGIYIENAKTLDAIECVAVADANPAAAQFRARQYDIPTACSPEELLANPEIEIVVNLTPNRLHYEVGTQIVQAGKSLYGEKPLTVYREESQKLLTAAAKAGVRVGVAPDTFFGGAWQTARKAIDDGLIGRPIAAMATLHTRRPGQANQAARPVQSPTRATVEGAVSFFATEGFKYGVTVVFDMGPYYLNALIHLLGPVRRVVGTTTRAFDEALRFENILKVESPTHVTGILEFADGAMCQFLASSDVLGTGLPCIEVYGTEGSLSCPDPNYFLGPVVLRKPESPEPIELECKHGYNQNSRGVGVADMAVAIKNGRPHRANGEMGAHVVDILNALHESSDTGRRIDLRTTCHQPQALPVDLPNWTIDD
jgi:predicted dehydrogenase